MAHTPASVVITRLAGVGAQKTSRTETLRLLQAVRQLDITEFTAAARHARVPSSPADGIRMAMELCDSQLQHLDRVSVSVQQQRTWLPAAASPVASDRYASDPKRRRTGMSGSHVPGVMAAGGPRQSTRWGSARDDGDAYGSMGAGAPPAYHDYGAPPPPASPYGYNSQRLQPSHHDGHRPYDRHDRHDRHGRDRHYR